MSYEALSDQKEETLGTRVVEDLDPDVVENYYKAHSWDDDEWSNLSTIVPYTAVLSITPHSPPAFQKKQLPMNKDPFITRLVNTVVKLEKKYAIPSHKRKARMFTRRPTRNTLFPWNFIPFIMTSQLLTQSPSLCQSPTSPLPGIRSILNQVCTVLSPTLCMVALLTPASTKHPLLLGTTAHKGTQSRF